MDPHNRTENLILGCGTPFAMFGTSCFYATPEKFNWQDGRNKCKNLGGDLAMIKTSEKQHKAKEYLDYIWEKCKCKYMRYMKCGHDKPNMTIMSIAQSLCLC